MTDLNFEKATVIYYDKFISNDSKNVVFDTMSKMFEIEIPQSVTLPTSLKSYKLNRKTMVFVDNDVDIKVIPKIWGDDVTINLFPQFLLDIKNDLEKLLKFKFNICLANYYSTGKKVINYHSDEEEKGSTSCIASISLGAERIFQFRIKGSKGYKDDDVYKSILLQNGSLIVMGEGCQENYEHRLPADKTCSSPRLNLTFRLFDANRYKNH